MASSAVIPSPGSKKDRSFLLCLLFVPFAVFVGFLWPHFVGEGCTPKVRQASAEALMHQLSAAVTVYELDYRAYPPGDGMGSRDLVRCLSRPGKHGLGMLGIPSEELHPSGGLRNPVNPETPIHYRHPGVHNPKTFDLWCEDADGREDGINNWKK